MTIDDCTEGLRTIRKDIAGYNSSKKPVELINRLKELLTSVDEKDLSFFVERVDSLKWPIQRVHSSEPNSELETFAQKRTGYKKSLTEIIDEVIELLEMK